MRIKKYQFYAVAFGLVGGISLTGNLYLLKENKKSNKEILQLEQELTWTQSELEDLKEIEEINSIDDLNQYFKGRLVFYVDEAAVLRDYFDPQLYIVRPENAFGTVEIPEAIYQRINYILSKREIHSLRFCNLGDEIDLTKLDVLSPINREMYYKNSSEDIVEIVIEDCKENFNYGVLQNIRPQYIEIKQDGLSNQMKEWLEAINLKNSNITIESDSTELLKFLGDTGKEIDTINIITNADEKHLDFIPKLHARKIGIFSRYFCQEHLDFDLSLNENTEEIELRFYNCDTPIEEINQLGKIKITSPNSNLYVTISSISGRVLHHANSITYITEQTEFDFPESSIVRLWNIKYRDKNQKLYEEIKYEKDMDLVSVLDQLLEENAQKKIGTN